MSLFKNKKEKKQAQEYYMQANDPVAKEIRNTGTSDALVWMQPEREFDENCRLVVMPGEEAVFIRDGAILQVFTNGSYTLNSKVYPFFQRLIRKIKGTRNVYECAIYFVRKSDSKEMLWGTQTPIQVEDNVYRVRTNAKARGAYRFQVADSALFLQKIVGAKVNCQIQEDLNDYFRNEFQGKIKSAISRRLNALQRTLVGVDAYSEEIAVQIKPEIDAVMQSYGLRCTGFSIAAIDVDVTKYNAMDEEIVRAQGSKSAMDILGISWKEKNMSDALRDIVHTTGAEGLDALGDNAIAKSIASTLGAEREDSVSRGEQRGMAVKQTVNVTEQYDPVANLAKLKRMLDAQLISESEYEAKKAEILKKL